MDFRQILVLLTAFSNTFVASQTLIGSIDVPLAAFLGLSVDQDATELEDTYSILVSTFSVIPTVDDTSYVIRNIGRYLDDVSQAPVLPVGDVFKFPREISQIPDDVFGFQAVVQPDGFVLPGKQDGTVHLIDVRDWENTVVHDTMSGRDDVWFYHRVLWRDMDGDGKKDALTCRGQLDSDTGETNAEMVWLQHPASPFTEDWPVNWLASDVCDTFFAFTELDGEEVLFTLGYFTHTLAIHWTTHPEGLWGDADFIESRVIDTGHQFFDIHIADLNNDNSLDLLVVLNAAVNGSLVAYQIPDDFRNGVYVRHLLADGFNETSGLGGGGAPGIGVTYRPNPSYDGKPYVALSGDDDGKAYILEPTSQDADDWTYNLNIIVDEGPGNIVGSVLVQDIDRDGYPELFASSYFQGKVYVFTTRDD